MDAVPTLGEDAKRLAVELYRQLALGEPVRQGGGRRGSQNYGPPAPQV